MVIQLLQHIPPRNFSGAFVKNQFTEHEWV